jgi:hypothetical protein
VCVAVARGVGGAGRVGGGGGGGRAAPPNPGRDYPAHVFNRKISRKEKNPTQNGEKLRTCTQRKPHPPHRYPCPSRLSDLHRLLYCMLFGSRIVVRPG